MPPSPTTLSTAGAIPTRDNTWSIPQISDVSPDVLYVPFCVCVCFIKSLPTQDSFQIPIGVVFLKREHFIRIKIINTYKIIIFLLINNSYEQKECFDIKLDTFLSQTTMLRNQSTAIVSGSNNVFFFF